MPSRYPFPWKTGFLILLDSLVLRSRSFREDAQTIESLLSQPPRIINRKNIPMQGPCLLVMNHYSQPDFGAWWIALSIANAVPVDIHWLMTAAWTFPNQPLLKPLIPVTYWLFSRTAQIYGFTNMPPMPPDPNQIQNRANAVRLALRSASTTQDPVIALAPEGRDYPGGILGAPPPGVGRFITKLVKHCQKIIPIGVYEEDQCLCLCFGEAFSIDLDERNSKETLDVSVSRQVMEAIAQQLPSNLRGEYS